MTPTQKGVQISGGLPPWPWSRRHLIENSFCSFKSRRIPTPRVRAPKARECIGGGEQENDGTTRERSVELSAELA